MITRLLVKTPGNLTLSESSRNIGGQNNRRGNRYEDYFATFKILAAITQFSDKPSCFRLKEQAIGPVDDLVSYEENLIVYHQLKADRKITWTAKSAKLHGEFQRQKADSISRGENFRLVLVVHEPRRRELLTKKLPPDIADVARVLRFPWVDRIENLLDIADIVDGCSIREWTMGACALRNPSRSNLTSLLQLLRLRLM
jgi:hypothetical protein